MKLADKKCSDGGSEPPLLALREGIVKGTRAGLDTQRSKAFGAALHLQGLRAVAGLCEQGGGCRGGGGPSSRSVCDLREVQDRDLVAQDQGSDRK